MALASIATQLLLNGFMSRTQQKTRELKKEWGYYALAVISGVISLSFLTAALYMGLMSLYAEPVAALLTGLVMGVTCLGFLYLGNRWSDRAETQAWVQSELTQAQLQSGLDELMSGIEKPVKENPGTAVLLATLAGFLTADKIH